MASLNEHFEIFLSWTPFQVIVCPSQGNNAGNFAKIGPVLSENTAAAISENELQCPFGQLCCVIVPPPKGMFLATDMLRLYCNIMGRIPTERLVVALLQEIYLLLLESQL